jgi:hypothetical protein
MPEEPNDGEWVDGDNVPLEGRIELLAVTVGVGDHLALVDPDGETHEHPAGVSELGTLVTLDLAGHIHLPGMPCIPTIVPFTMTPEVFGGLLTGLKDVVDQIAQHDARRTARGEK